MARNFKVLVHRKTSNLHLELMGDFDGASAFYLLNVLGENCQGAEGVFIDTDGLKSNYPFGWDIFFNHLPTLADRHIRPKFGGKYAEEILSNWKKGALTLKGKTGRKEAQNDMG